jgi:putative ABC transport system permease protein
MIEIPRALIADPDVFEVFSFRLIQGDPRTALLEPNTVVITEETARRIFREVNPMGQVLQGVDSEIYTVTGVVENTPETSHIQFDMLVSIMEMRNHPVQWDNYDHYSPTYIFLKKSADPNILESKLPAHTKKYFRMNADHVALSLQPMRDIHLHSQHIMWEINWLEGDITYIYFFSIIMIFILLVACINFINLSTARSIGRAREVGIRKVIGANKLQLVRQFLGESLFFSICAIFFAVTIVQTIKPLLNSILGVNMSFEYLNNAVFAVAILSFLLAAGILAGIYPALVLSSFRPVVVLKGSIFQEKKSDKLRKILVMVQFAVSIMLIFCTAVVSKQFLFMKNKDTGFNKAQVVVLPMTEQIQLHFDAIREELFKLPGIEGITASTRKLGTPLWRNQIFFEGKNPQEQWISPYMAVDYDFISFYGIRLLEGRDFSPDYAADSESRSYIINETLAKQIGWDNPIGKKFKIGDLNWGTVVGVVNDFNFRSLHHKIEPVAFYIYRPWFFHMSVRIGTSEMKRTLGYLEQKLQPYRGELPFLYSFLDEDFARNYENEEKSGQIFGIFTLLAIVISCLGLLALASFTAEQKSKEIGIRKILGSSVLDIIVMLSWKFTKWVILANILALPVAWFVMNRWLQNFAYRIHTGMDTFLLASGLALLCSLVAVSFKVFRAASADPIDSIRYE